MKHSVELLDGPGRREAAVRHFGWHGTSKFDHSKPFHLDSPRNVRIAPNSGSIAATLYLTSWANVRHQPHSITSSAATSRVAGTVRPSAFAALRLITSSNLVGCINGMSLGFAPLRIWSAM